MEADSQPGPPGPANDRPWLQVPSVLWCGLMIFVVKTALRARGFGPTLRWLRRRVEDVPVLAEVHIEAVRAVELAVAIASALYPGRALCLEQSLVLYYLLRKTGVPAQFRIGVQPYPFLAHAWVQYQGKVVTDVPEHVKRFAVLPGVLP